MSGRERCEQILDLARWAPSGDNTQPWRFEIVTDEHIVVYGHDTRDHVLYDIDGHPSHIAHGALLETLRIAATGFGLDATWALREGTPDTAPIYDVKLNAIAGLQADPLIPCIKTRTVQRRPMRMTPLTADQRRALCDAPRAGYRVKFFESFAERRRIAGLLWDNAYIRLTCPEAYPVHRDIIEWNARYSKDRIPDQAVGVDPLTCKLMRWALHSWSRVDFFNRYLLGTIPPRIQLDFLPAIFCASHMLIQAEKPPATVTDYVQAGIAMQRLWLTATAAGLHLQPEMTPVIFRWYARSGKNFSASPAVMRDAEALAALFEGVAGARQTDAFTFFCRVGHSAMPRSRSVRKELNELMYSP